ncbi:hypothetical protein KIPB_005195 [Kipferlia bialata]|uniref:Uncharacterized protein n=1 Tax=Kipferlia bialata TaxID=797122 RepID=A0A391P2E6_9EUKA|nr:hypothetical protein KIPB_005195 [Kipferlia bialata]|eukprot:g5195.t1
MTPDITIRDVTHKGNHDSSVSVEPLPVVPPTFSPSDASDAFIPKLASYTREAVARTYEDILADGVIDRTRLPFDEGINSYVLLPRGKIFSLKLAGLNLDSDARVRILKHNQIQRAFVEMEEFDASICELHAPIPLPLRINTYMNIAERYEGLSGETRKVMVLSHFDHLEDPGAPSLDLVSSMIEWSTSLKRGTVQAEFNQKKGGLFGCCMRGDDKKRREFENRVADEAWQHETKLQKRKFRLEAEEKTK